MSTGRKLTDFLLSVLKSVLYYQLKLFSEKELEIVRNTAPFQARKISVMSQDKSQLIVRGTELDQIEYHQYQVLPLMS